MTNPVFMEMEMHRRADEARREAEQARLVRLARGEPEPRIQLHLAEQLAHLRCRLLDWVVGLGFAIERCMMVPARSVGQPR